jgi:hypothetical protein
MVRKIKLWPKVYLKVFVRKFQVKTAFTFKVVSESFSWKNNSLVIIYRFGSHKYFKIA